MFTNFLTSLVKANILISIGCICLPRAIAPFSDP